MERKLYLLYFLTAGFLFAQTSPSQMIQKMGRGINLGNVLSAPVEGNWSGIATQQYFIDVANAGFTNVRIPIDFFGYRTEGDTSTYDNQENTTFEGSRNDFIVNSTYLNRVEEVVSWGLDQGLVIILDFHGANLKEEFIYTFDLEKSEYTHPTSAKRAADLEKFYAIWEQIAERFKNYSDDLVFEVINEPYFHISANEMNEINTEVISIVRSSGSNNSTRKIIITGGSSNSYEAPLEISNGILNSDDYLIATFHYYRPFSFTKSTSMNFNDNNWGSLSEKSTVDSEFDIVKNWADGFTPPLAVYVGEFGADNSYGYDYSSGDLHEISSNSPPTFSEGTGFADGGPDPNSRIYYHNYIANAAIERGFAFSAWDGGGKSTKTIHFRKDSGLSIYDMDYFEIDSFLPKYTSSSLVIDDSIWVEEVKDALLEGYINISCNNSNILKNLDFECGYNNHWSIFPNNNSDKAIFEDSGFKSRSGSHGGKVSVFESGALNSVILQNESIPNLDANLDNKDLTYRFYSKASNENQQMRIRLKYNVGTETYYILSPIYNLSATYPEDPYEFISNIASGSKNLQLQIIFGKDVGTYFFDDFTTSIQTLSVKTLRQDFQTFPNPVSNYFNITTSEEFDKIKLYDIQGKVLKIWSGKRIIYDTSFLDNGLYLLEIYTDNQLLYTSKLVKTKN